MSGQRLNNRSHARRIQSSDHLPEPIGSGGDLVASVPPVVESPLEDAHPVPKRRSRTAKPATAKPTRIQDRDHSTDVPEGKLTGVVGDASTTGSRSGEDVRKRGWFWHWNSIVTQYAPLIGLKGVGLLNSYTVWTDRREESPHRGYAFPSQQSEADFYGEDRAELITINKILVALDLIEIRKEMVLRVDAQGRRWKVPHNLYRVKDHGDDVSLTAKDVMAVVQLADKDRTVYRYCRRMFSPRFSPIDNDNIWHQILSELRPTDVWQRMAARTEKDETKASARSKAGHAARRVNDDSELFSLPKSGDKTASKVTVSDSSSNTANDSAAVESDEGDKTGQTSVVLTNNGLMVDVEPTNSGSSDFRSTTVQPVNTGQATSVAPTNTTYYQDLTTTTKGDPTDSEYGVRTERHPEQSRFGAEEAPDSARSEDQARIAFEEANSRPTSPAERRQLRQLAERVVTLGFPSQQDPWKLIAAAIEDAVGAGSAFVAPKRIREILIRWSRDGVPAEYAENVSLHGAESSLSQPQNRAVTGVDGFGHRLTVIPTILMPNGKTGAEIWAAVEHAMCASLGVPAARDLFAGSSIVGYETGTVSILVTSDSQSAAFTETHLDLVTRKLGSTLRRPVRLSVAVNSPDPDDDNDGIPDESDKVKHPGRQRVSRDRRPVAAMTLGAMPVFTIERCGMTNRQVWALVLNDLREAGTVARADVDAWLRDAVVLAVDGRGSSVSVRLGVPHVLAKRRIEGRLQAPVRHGLARMLGAGERLELQISLIREWLHEQQDEGGADDGVSAASVR